LHFRDARDFQFAGWILAFAQRLHDLADRIDLGGGRLDRDQQPEVEQLDHRNADQHQYEDAREQRPTRRAPGIPHARTTRGTNR
jgi:hypothetical protein